MEKTVEVTNVSKSFNRQDVLKAIARDVRISRFEVSSPSLNEIFIKVVEE